MEDHLTISPEEAIFPYYDLGGLSSNIPQSFQFTKENIERYFNADFSNKGLWGNITKDGNYFLLHFTPKNFLGLLSLDKLPFLSERPKSRRETMRNIKSGAKAIGPLIKTFEPEKTASRIEGFLGITNHTMALFAINNLGFRLLRLNDHAAEHLIDFILNNPNIKDKDIIKEADKDYISRYYVKWKNKRKTFFIYPLASIPIYISFDDLKKTSTRANQIAIYDELKEMYKVQVDS